MPLDVRGCTRATLTGSACAYPTPAGAGNPLNPIRDGDRGLQLFPMNEEFPVSAGHKLALIKSLPFVHTARRYYRLDGLVRPSDRPRRGRPTALAERWEDGRTWLSRGSKSRNKVSVGEPAEGSLTWSVPRAVSVASPRPAREPLLHPCGAGWEGKKGGRGRDPRLEGAPPRVVGSTVGGLPRWCLGVRSCARRVCWGGAGVQSFGGGGVRVWERRLSWAAFPPRPAPPRPASARAWTASARGSAVLWLPELRQAISSMERSGFLCLALGPPRGNLEPSSPCLLARWGRAPDGPYDTFCQVPPERWGKTSPYLETLTRPSQATLPVYRRRPSFPGAHSRAPLFRRDPFSFPSRGFFTSSLGRGFPEPAGPEGDAPGAGLGARGQNRRFAPG